MLWVIGACIFRVRIYGGAYLATCAVIRYFCSCFAFVLSLSLLSLHECKKLSEIEPISGPRVGSLGMYLSSYMSV